MPKELVATLERTPKAFFDTLPASRRREYIDWISVAKKTKTRTRRSEQTISILKFGRRHYEKNR